MAPKVFLTGATGYIGGDGLFTIASTHPDWEFSALVRSEEKANQVTSKYPQIRTVIGDLDSSELIEEEVKKADIVFHFADCDHVAAAKAITKGAQHHTPERPLWLIHTSGTGILTVEDQRAGTYGIERPKEYNDWEGVSELVNLPSDAFHRNVDEIIIGAGQQSPASVKVAVVCPPTIYGPGRGPGNTKSIQAYLLSAAVLKRKHGILVGKGENIWHQVHVQDLSNVYLALGEAASVGGGKATWNNEGYYLAENGSFVWGDIQRAIAQSAFDKKLIASPNVESLDGAQTTEVHPAGVYAWGSNSRGNSIRARKLFGWTPQKPKLIDLIPDIVEGEAKSLSLL
ncbi:Semialdehyde dehydrogenase, NAD-binding [Penicillium griseofulvum]|uniref:Semialdehyde dehydrogenase, NAD-binding n=1 Tax=Penicillium patulum TaxID=5078 RepID=A0A135LLG6_PENPA|nr:Semialdehyde dehydrogenase, NAD-binding [Penicillium griseofulvum]KXG49812.1 Semialdehyde dehydrogenase, NAD-binding [Penicillium griseofulvum]